MRALTTAVLVCMLCNTGHAAKFVTTRDFMAQTNKSIELLKTENSEIKSLVAELESEITELKKKITELIVAAKEHPAAQSATMEKPAHTKKLKTAADQATSLKIIDIRYPRTETAIYTGPGTNYPKDSSGNISKHDTAYVVEEQDSWIRFRVTGVEVGWYGWIQKNKTVSQIQQWVSQGILERVDVATNEARVDPSTWHAYTLDEKQGLVGGLSQYFDIRGSTGRVTILSSLADKKFATYSVWSGIKILE